MSEVTQIPRSLAATLRGTMMFDQRVKEAFGPLFGVDPTADGKKLFGFHMRRANPKKGRVRQIDVWLWIGDAGSNLSAYKIAPPFQERQAAYDWAREFAKAHGFPPLMRSRNFTRFEPPPSPPKLRVIEGGHQAQTGTP